MTLIATVISPYGIIHASDSNLSASSGAVGSGKKVFRLPFGNSALAVAGRYTVGGQDMNDWMPATFDAYTAANSPTLQGFAHYLGNRLTAEVGDKGASLVHLAGYVDDGAETHPEFYFVRNIDHIHPSTGAYEGINKRFEVTEDFWTRDYLNAGTRAALANGGYQSYFNGFPDGRIAYVTLSAWLRQFFGQVWANRDWQFRPPSSLDELVSFVSLEIRAICTLFLSSNYPAAYIGGDVQIEAIAPPSNAITL